MCAKRTFGQVSRLPSTRYRARYTGPDGALHSAPWTFETSGDAEAWLVDERRLISSVRWTPPKVRAEVAQRAEAARRSRVFGRYAQDWLEGRHDLRPSTRRSYQTALDRHLVPWFGDSPIDEITVNDVRAWFASYGEQTQTARAHAYAVLTAVMGQAAEDELIVRTPCRVRGGGKSKVRREPKVLTLPELLALAEAMPEHHRALTLLCGLCGLRFGEAVALRRRDLDLDRGLVHVTRTATKDGREKTVGAPKTAAGSRTVAMPQLVVDARVWSTATAGPTARRRSASPAHARPSASPPSTGTTCGEPLPPSAPRRAPPSARCRTASGTPPRRWLCTTRARPPSVTA